MKRIPARYQEVVAKALEFMRAHPEATTEVADVAAHVACSPTNLWRMFMAVTGKGVFQNLRDVRIEKARTLLRDTSMTVTEVAYSAGFENHSAFTRWFRHVTRTPPTLFRHALLDAGALQPSAAARPPAAAKLDMQDDFTGPRLAGWWKPVSGKWTLRDGQLEGQGINPQNDIKVATRLPENFRAEFQVQFELNPDRPPTGLSVALQGSDMPGKAYCAVYLAHPNQEPGYFRIGQRHVLWSPDAALPPRQWCQVRLELNDNCITLFLDRKRVFTYRLIFPPPYAGRSHLAISALVQTLRLRYFRLFDLGFLPVAPQIRQGDALFNSGLYAQAQEFYERHLQAGSRPDEELELRYKIGVCMFRQGQIAGCRDWMQSIMPLASDPYWRRECDLVLLQADADTRDTGPFERHLRSARRDAHLREGIRPIIADYFQRLRAAGFLDRTLRVAQLWCAMEKDAPAAIAARPASRLAGLLKHTRRFAEAERLLKRLTRPVHSAEVQADALVSLSDIALMRGRPDEARRLFEAVRRSGSPYLTQAWCDVQEAACLRSEGKFREAVERLLAIPEQPAEIRAYNWDSRLQAAELLYGMGEPAKARRLVEQVRAEWPEIPFPDAATFRQVVRVAALSERRFTELAGILLRNAWREDAALAERGQNAVTAGLLFELAGEGEEALRVWGETTRRFPPDRCYYWGSLANALSTGKPDRLETAAITWQVRSEMACLAGLLYRHRGDTVRARRLFKLAVKEDPALHWPAWLARQAIAAAPPA